MYKLIRQIIISKTDLFNDRYIFILFKDFKANYYAIF